MTHYASSENSLKVHPIDPCIWGNVTQLDKSSHVLLKVPEIMLLNII